MWLRTNPMWHWQQVTSQYFILCRLSTPEHTSWNKIINFYLSSRTSALWVLVIWAKNYSSQTRRRVKVFALLANFVMLFPFLASILYYHLFLWLTWSRDPVLQRAHKWDSFFSWLLFVLLIVPPMCWYESSWMLIIKCGGVWGYTEIFSADWYTCRCQPVQKLLQRSRVQLHVAELA